MKLSTLSFLLFIIFASFADRPTVHAQDCSVGNFAWQSAFGVGQAWPANTQSNTFTLAAGGPVNVTLEIIDPFNRNADADSHDAATHPFDPSGGCLGLNPQLPLGCGPEEVAGNIAGNGAILDPWDADCARDFTQTAGVYGPDYFTIWMYSANSDEEVEYRFTFDRPTIIQDFLISDIDAIGFITGAPCLENDLGNSYQDEVRLSATDVCGSDVALDIQSSTAQPFSQIIIDAANQTARSEYNPNQNNNLNPNDQNSEISITATKPVTSFSIFYSNGPDDEAYEQNNPAAYSWWSGSNGLTSGVSDDHAIRIDGFQFCTCPDANIQVDGGSLTCEGNPATYNVSADYPISILIVDGVVQPNPGSFTVPTAVATTYEIIVEGADGCKELFVFDNSTFVRTCFDLALTKSNATPNPIAPGDDVTYTITVENQGSNMNQDVTNAMVTEYPPAGWTINDPNWPSGIYTIPYLAAGSSTQIMVTLTSPLGMNDGTYVNYAEVTGFTDTNGVAQTDVDSNDDLGYGGDPNEVDDATLDPLDHDDLDPDSVEVVGPDCNCADYLYVNEVANGGRVHKFRVNPDGTLFEINPSGPWYPNGGVSEMPSPHGLGSDLNGYLYIGSSFDTDGAVRKLSCDGDIFPIGDFSITGSTHNITSIGNILYHKEAGATGGELTSYDLCEEQLIHQYCFEDSNGNVGAGLSWGFHLGDDGYFYGGWDFNDDGIIYKFLPSETNACATPLITGIFNDDGFPANVRSYGTATDPAGYIYQVVADGYPGPAQILKYDPTGNYVGQTPIDSSEGDGGWYGAIGLAYSAECDCLYTSNGTRDDDCVSIFSTNLVYGGAAVGPVGDAVGENAYESFNKAIGIITECCPKPNAFTGLTETVCIDASNTTVFLTEYLQCSFVCAGQWNEISNNAGVFNDCNDSFTVTNTGLACFEYAYTATNENSICDPFVIDICITFVLPPEPPEISITDNVCAPSTPGSINVDTPCADGSVMEWSTDGGITWTSAAPTYDRLAPISVRARCFSDDPVLCVGTAGVEVVSSPNTCYDLALTKTGATPNPIAPGDDVTFTITVENQGSNMNQDVINAMVTEYPPAGWTINDSNWPSGMFTIPYLAAGSSTQLMVTLTAPIPLASGVYTNYAEVTSFTDTNGNPQVDVDSDDDLGYGGDPNETDNVTDNTGGDHDDLDPDPVTVIEFDLALSKTGATPNPIAPGADVTFAVTVENQGTVAAQDVINAVVTEYPPPGWTINDPNWPGGIFTIPYLAAGSSTQLMVTLTAPNPLTAGVYTNYAEVTSFTDTNGNPQVDVDSEDVLGYGGDPGEVDNATTDPADHDDLDPDPVTVVPFDLALTKSNATPNPITAGDDVTFTVAVENQGTVPAQDVINAVVTEYPPAGWTINDPNWPGGLFTIPYLAAGSSTQLTVTLTAPNPLAPGIYTNYAEVTDFTDTNGNPQVDVDSEDVLGYGGDTNEVDDATTDPADHDDLDPDPVTVIEFDLALFKTGATPNPTVAGADVTFTITVVNQGTIPAQDAANIMVTEYPPAGWTINDPAWPGGVFTIPFLAAGDSIPLTVTLTAPIPLNDGVYTNYAEVTSFTDTNDTTQVDIDSEEDLGYGGDTNEIDNVITDPSDHDDLDPDPVTVGTPSISLEKTVYPGDDGGASCDGMELVSGILNDVVTYCFVVTNTGGITLSGVQITDDDLTLLPLPYSTEVDAQDNDIGSGGIEWSGISYNCDNGTVMIADDNDILYEYALDAAGNIVGPPLRTIDVAVGGGDVEGVAWISGDTYAVLAENVGEVFIVNIPSPITTITATEVLSSFTTGIAELNSAGNEGIAYDAASGTFWIVDEKPPTLYNVDQAGTVLATLPLPTNGTYGITDSSSVYVTPAGVVYVLSDESQLLVEYDVSSGSAVPVSSQALPGFQQAEGVTFSCDLASLYIAGEIGGGGLSYAHFQNPPGITINLPDLAPGQVYTASVVSAIYGDLVNTADVSGLPSTPDGTPIPGTDSVTDVDTAEVEAVEWDLALTKTGATPNPIQPGADVTFTITVENQGTLPPQDVRNAEVTDYPPAGWTINDPNWLGGVYTIPYLAAGSTTQLTITLTAPIPLMGGVFTNYAEVTSFTDTNGTPQADIDSDDDLGYGGDPNETDDITDNTGGDHDDLDPDPVAVVDFDLALTKTGATPNPIAPGADVTFTVTVENQGSDPAQDVINAEVTEYPPAGWTINDPNWPGGIYTIPYLAAGSSTQLTVTLTAPNPLTAGIYTNYAEVTSFTDTNGNAQVDADSEEDLGYGGDTNETDNVTDNTGGDHDDLDPDPVEVIEFDLALTKTGATPNPIERGDDVTFTIMVENQGTVAAQDVINAQVTEYPPAGWTINDPNWPGGIYTIPYLAAGSSTQLMVTLTAPDPLAPGVYTNYAEVTDFTDTNGNPQVDVDSNDDLGYGGDPDETDNATDNTGGDHDDLDPDPVTVVEFDLALTKVLSTAIPPALEEGDIVTFTIDVINQGSITATQIALTDYVPAGMTLADPAWTATGNIATLNTPIAGPLAPMASTNVTISFTIDPGVTDGTILTNYAEISSALDDEGNPGDDVDSTPDGNNDDPVGGDNVTDNSNGDEDDHDPAAVPIGGFYDLALIKVLSSPGPFQVGDPVTFTITVTNQGTQTGYDILLTDYIPAGLTLNDTAWTDAGGVATLNAAIAELMPMASTNLTISFTIDAGVEGLTLTNVAEISQGLDGDDVDGMDIDSTPDTTNDDPIGADNVTDNSNGDEDDHDPAPVFVEIFDLALIKVLSSPGPFVEGDPVTFTLTVTNQGTITAEDIFVTDYVPAGLTLNDTAWAASGSSATTVAPIASLAPGASVPLTITFTIDAGATGVLTNYSEISAANNALTGGPGDDVDSTPDANNDDPVGGDNVTDNSNGDEDDHDPAELPLAGVFDLALVKVLSSPGPFQAGDPATFTITVTNQGTMTAYDIAVTDYIPAGLTLADSTWTEAPAGTATANALIPVLSPGGSTNLTITVTIDAGTGATVLTNLSEISAANDGSGNPGMDVDSTPDAINDDPIGGDNVTDNSNGDEDDHDPAPLTVDVFDLALIKVLSSPGPFAEGDPVTFTITVTNQGTIAAEDIFVTDYIPAGITLNDAAWASSGSSATTVTPIPTLAPGASMPLTIRFTIDAGTTGTLTNYTEISTATDATTGGPGLDVDSTPDANNDDPVGGDNVTDNSNGDEDDHDPAELPVGGVFDLALIKVLSSPGPFQVGDPATFTITVTNQGTMTAYDIEVTDYIPAGLTLADTAWTEATATANTLIPVLAPGASTNLTIMFTIDSGTENQTLVNLSEISAANDGSGNPGMDVDSTPDAINDDPVGGDNVTDNRNGDEDDHDPAPLFVEVFDLALTKVLSNGPGPFEEGDPVVYTIMVTNQGTIAAENIVVSDYIPSGLTLNDGAWTEAPAGTATINTPIASLAAGASTMLTISLTIDPGVTDGTILTNYAEISAADNALTGGPGDDVDSTPDAINDDPVGGDNVTDNSNGDEDDHDPAIVPIGGFFDLALIKVLSSPGPFQVGDPVTFTITVTNQGNQTAYDIQISDYVPMGLTLADGAWSEAGGVATMNTLIPSLAPLGTIDIPITFTINAGTEGATMVNVAEISQALDGDGVPGDDIDSVPDGINDDVIGTDNVTDNSNGDEDDHDPATVTVEVFDLALIKVLSSTGPFEEGDPVTFTITVTNQGTIAAEDIFVTDYIPAGLTLNDSAWAASGSSATTVAPIASLAPGASAMLTISFTIDAGVNGVLTNYSEISAANNALTGLPGDDVDSTPDGNNDDPVGGDNVTDNSNGDEDDHDPAVLPVGGVFDLALIKVLSSPGPFQVGDPVTFTIIVTNQGTMTAFDIQISDYIPTGLTLADGAWTETAGVATMNALISVLAPGASVDVPITFTIDAGSEGATLVNTAEISQANDGSGGLGMDLDSTPDDTNDDPIGGDNTTDNSNGDEDDHDPAELSVEVFDLALIKMLSSAGPFEENDPVTFMITVTNQGTIAAENVVVSDYMPAGLTLADAAWTASGGVATLTTPIANLPAGGSAMLPIMFTIDPGVTGVLTNVAEISAADNALTGLPGDDVDSTPDANNDDPIGGDNVTDNSNGDEDDHDPAILPIGGFFDLALTKVLTTSGPHSVGETVSYTILVTNQGTLDATNIGISDYIPAGLTLADGAWTEAPAGTATLNTPIASLAAGAVTSVTIMFTIDAAAAGASLVNFAEISSASDGAGNPVTDIDSTPDAINDDPVGGDNVTDNSNGDEDDHDPAELTVTVFDLALTKVLSTVGPFAPGDPVTFTIMVTNQGTVAAANIVLADYIPAGLVLADSDWTEAPAGTATLNTPIASLAVGGSTMVPIGFTIASGFSGTLTNVSEIAAADNADSGLPGDDIDSTPDAMNNDVIGGDDVTDNSNGDEDDHDPAELTVPVLGPAIMLIKRAGTAPDGDTYVISAAAGVLYTYDVTNIGDTHLSDITITDDAGTPGDASDDVTLTSADCPGLAGPLAPNGMVQCTLTLNVAEDTVNMAGTVGNPTDENGNDIPGLPDVTDDDPAIVVLETLSIGSTVFLDPNDNGLQDPGEPGIPGILVEVLDSAGNVVGSDTTDADGNYYVDGLPEGDYTVQITTPPSNAPSSSTPTNMGDDQTDGDDNGDQPGGSGTTVTSSTITLMLGDEPVGQETEQGGDQDGTNDANGDMTIDFGFAPSGPAIQLIKRAGTVADGGTYTISAPGGVLYTFDVTNIGDTHLSDITITDDAGTPGDASDDVTLTSADCPGLAGPLAPNGMVQCTLTLNVAEDTVNMAGTVGNPTDENGNDIPGLPDVTDDDPAIVVLETLSIGSTVFLDPNDNGLQDPGEPGIPGILVEVLDSAGNVVGSDTTDADGNYYVDGLPEGDYTVQITTPPSNAPSSSTPTNMGDDQTDGDDNGDQPGGSGTTVTSGTITLSLGDEPSGESEQGGDQDGTNDANGDMTIDFGFVPSGPAIQLIKRAGTAADGDTYTISAPGGVLYTYDVTNIGDTHLSDITITDDAGTPGDASDDVTLTSADCPGLAGPLAPNGMVQCTLTLNVDEDTVNMAGTVGNPTDENGNDIPGLPDVTDDDPAIVVLETLSIGSSVFYDPNDNGTQDPGETGIPGILVEVLDSAGNVVGSDITDADGNYYVDGLPEGDYTVQITTPPSNAPSSSTPTNLGDDQTDGDDNGDQPGGSGTTVTSGTITLSLGDEPSGESEQGGDQDGTNDANGDMTIDFGFVPAPAIRLVKTVYQGHNGGASCPGTDLETGLNNTAVTYCFEVTNTGSTHLNNITVNDTDLDPDFTSVIGLMAPGDVVMVHHETVINGDLVNVADVTGDPANPDGSLLPIGPATDDDPAEVREVAPAIALDKKLTTTAANQDGSYQITFEFIARNTGDAPLHNLVLTDDILGQFGDVSPIGFMATSGTLAANPGWNGFPASNVLAPGQSLAVGAVGNVFVTFTVTPGSNALERDNLGDITGDHLGLEVADSATEPVVLLSLGNFVWFDYDNDGIPDATEPAVAGVQVQLLDSAGNVVQTDTTDSSGYYLFDLLKEGTYSVLISPSNFQAGGPLAGSFSSGPTEANPDDDVDLNDNGIDDPNPALNGIVSGPITLAVGGEPSDDIETGTGSGSATDDSSNLTVDFGFFLPASLGDTVWQDNSADGILNEDLRLFGISNVRVYLFDANNNQIDVTTTDQDGFYEFTGLMPGTYSTSVELDDIPVELEFSSTPPSYTTTLGPGEHDATLDYGFYPPPTAIELEYFEATVTDTGVSIAWATAWERDSLGFFVYRLDADGTTTKLNEALILATGGGSEYSLDIADATGGRYILEEIETDLDSEIQSTVAYARVPAAPVGEPTRIVTATDNLVELVTTPDYDTYMVVGFDGFPQVIDFTDPAQPRELVGEVLETGTGKAAYFSAPAGVQVLVQEREVIEEE